MKPSDFKRGDKVTYVPDHAKNDLTHPDRQEGLVSSHNHIFVFVKYFRYMKDGLIWPPIYTGDEPYTAAATNVKNLIRR